MSDREISIECGKDMVIVAEKMRILLVEDYKPLQESVAAYLEESGFIVDSTDSGDEGLWYAENHQYDAFVLDIMLPKVSGLDILKKIRKAGKMSPVIMTSALDTVENRVRGLNAGADDYLVKPFALSELLARLHAHIRSHHSKNVSEVTVGKLDIDLQARKVRYAGEEVELSAREYSILEYLAYRQGEVVTRKELWSSVYGEEDGGGSNALDVYVGYIRKKINLAGENFIKTHRGLGYSLEA